MQPFNLRVRSYYSLLDSILSIDDIIQHAIDNHLDYAFLIDKNNLYGAMEFYTKAIQHHLKPIIGLEFNWLDSAFILIAKNYNGLKHLIKISSHIMCEEEYNLNDYLDDNLFIICTSNNYHNIQYQVWNENDLFLNEVCYPKKEDNLCYTVIQAIKNNQTIDLSNESHNSLHWINEADVSTHQKECFMQIINETNLIINDNASRLPMYNNKINSHQYLQEIALNGLLEKLHIEDNKMPKNYYDRLLYELNVIHELDYDDYFLIVADFINFAKKNEIIIGPGRGSSGGSLVAYALNITEIDPLKYNLVFERFLNKDRKTMPDIDVDVMDSRRDELIEYIFNKYLPTNVCQIITFQRIKHKMALRDVGRVLKIPLNIIDNITKRIPLNLETSLIEYVLSDKDLKAYYQSYPELFEISHQLYNIPRQFSTHAAGILIANEQMNNIIPVQTGMNNFLLSQWSMEYLEMFGLNKIDILGLKNLSIIYDTLSLIKERHHKSINLQNINLEDEKIFAEIQKANTNGIFQLESPGMKSTLIKIQPHSIDDISLVSALFRPGPQMMINDYAKTRKDPSLIKYKNEDFKKILSATNGFCIYQEQVIALIQSVTGFSIAKADIFRRAISKKKIDLFDKMHNEFIEAAINNHYSQQEAQEVYDLIIEFANYGFNRSHSIAYAFIAYQMMYLKCYYPLEFICSLLKHDAGTNLKNNIYLSEAKKIGIKISNIDITQAGIQFKIVNNSIMLGLQSIKGFGIEMAKKIIDIRQATPFQDFEQTITCLNKNKISLKNIEILIKIGAFDNFGKDRNFLLTNLNAIIKKFEAINPLTNLPVFDTEYDERIVPMSEEDKANYENEYLGYTFSNNQILILVNEYQEAYQLDTLSNPTKPMEFNLLAQVKNVKKTFTKTGKEMAFIVVYDGNLEESIASFNPEIFHHLENNHFYIFKVRCKNNKLDITNVIKHL